MDYPQAYRLSLLCIFCKSEETKCNYEPNSNLFYVVCSNCGARGPEKHTEEEAKKAWYYKPQDFVSKDNIYHLCETCGNYFKPQNMWSRQCVFCWAKTQEAKPKKPCENCGELFSPLSDWMTVCEPCYAIIKKIYRYWLCKSRSHLEKIVMLRSN
jgi:hypothetical protein